MLILTRRIGDVLRIGDDIRIVVLGINGNQVKLGTTAPQSIAVHRQEIYDRMATEKSRYRRRRRDD